ncbi:DUF3060 domain-containing protein [Luteimonas sp. BDR2-5]|uniref:DUF3060 domain-containing protein n=1 Tax=Proluteimonas luteida TaxID=2878685 RepID=UPI001E45C558|nr:DUF3060 domain-containing protein [Luteimonas sp. BDR2-5]MCD9028670.1 DUF3060 domain-containing protein [Luteimonas sp. BDR2-5]
MPQVAKRQQAGSHPLAPLHLLPACLLASALAACGTDGDSQRGSASTDPAEAGRQVLSATTGGELVDPASGALCTGNDVRITRDDFRIVLDGDCGAVVVTASNGTLNVASAASLHVEGNHVTVLNTKVGDVEVGGRDNTLNLTEAGNVRIAGDSNSVLARHVDSVEFTGTGNLINPDNTPPVEDNGRGNRVL